MDCEWKPTRTYFAKENQGASILQIASETHVFVVDLLKADKNYLSKILHKIIGC
jgi:hypothetical protein